MAKSFSSKDLSILLGGLEDQGCRVTPIKSAAGGYRVLPPNNGRPITIHGTMSDKRGFLNMRAEVKRQGLAWPLEG